MALENVSLEEMESLATLSKTLADNPATRRQFLELVKTASPMTNIPEIDLEVRLEGKTKPLMDKIQSLEAQLNEKNFKEMRQSAHTKLQNMGLTTNDIGEVEKLMVEKKIGDYETAGEFYMNQKQSAAPSAGTFANPNIVPDMKSFGSDINAWARGEAFSAMNDIIKGRSR